MSQVCRIPYYLPYALSRWIGAPNTARAHPQGPTEAAEPLPYEPTYFTAQAHPSGPQRFSCVGSPSRELWGG